MTFPLRRGRRLAVLAATCTAALAATTVLAAGAASAVADPGAPTHSSNDPHAGELDRTRSYSVCNYSGTDLQLVNLFTDAPAMFSSSPNPRGPAQYPVLSTLPDNACDDYRYGIEMHNTHHTSAVYMNPERTALVNIKGAILPSSDGPDAWHTNTDFRYVFDSRAGYAGPTLLVRVDTGSRRVQIVQGGSLGGASGAGSLGTGSLGASSLGTGSLGGALGDTPSSTARLSSANIRVYDFTTYDLRFARPDWGLPNPADPDAVITARPTAGATMSPGDYQEVALTPHIKMHGAQLRYESAQFPGRGVTISVITDDDSSNNRSTVECTGSGYTCVTDGKDSIYLLDDVDRYPSSAVRDVPAADDQTQFDMLRTLCTATSGAQCTYHVSGKRNTLSEPSRVTPVVYSDVPWTFSREVTVTNEVTSSITHGAEVGIAYDVMSASVAREYGTSTTKSHSYTDSATYDVPAAVYFWVQARSPVVRYTGDFTFSLKGAGVIRLKDVTYDVPDPTGFGMIEQVNSAEPPLAAPGTPR